jgi:organic hydroperoxide reductase OsmC/OhrA
LGRRTYNCCRPAGIGLGEIAVTVTLNLEGKPLIATAAAMDVSCETLDGSDPRTIIDRAKAISMVGNSLRRGVPVTVAMTGRADKHP